MEVLEFCAMRARRQRRTRACRLSILSFGTLMLIIVAAEGWLLSRLIP